MSGHVATNWPLKGTVLIRFSARRRISEFQANEGISVYLGAQIFAVPRTRHSAISPRFPAATTKVAFWTGSDVSVPGAD